MNFREKRFYQNMSPSPPRTQFINIEMTTDLLDIEQPSGLENENSRFGIQCYNSYTNSLFSLSYFDRVFRGLATDITVKAPAVHINLMSPMQ